MSFELLSCLLTLFVLAGIGTPIGYSILLASLVYLGVAGLDVALAGEKILQGFYKSYDPACRAFVHRRRQHHERGVDH